MMGWEAPCLGTGRSVTHTHRLQKWHRFANLGKRCEAKYDNKTCEYKRASWGVCLVARNCFFGGFVCQLRNALVGSFLLYLDHYPRAITDCFFSLPSSAPNLLAIFFLFWLCFAAYHSPHTYLLPLFSRYRG